MATVQHVVQVVGSEPRMDLWCDECQTSGRFEIDIHVLGSQGTTTLGTVRQCVRCDYEDEEAQR